MTNLLFSCKRIILALVLAWSGSVNAVTIWEETFQSYSNGDGICGTNGDNNRNIAEGANANGVDDWTNDNICGGSRRFYVRTWGWTRLFTGRDTDGEANWYSETIRTTGYTAIGVSMNYDEWGTMEADDDVEAFYSLDGGGWQSFGYKNDDGSGTFTVAGLAPVSTIQVRFYLNCNETDEYWYMDNIRVTGTVATTPTVITTSDATVSCTAENLTGEITADGGSAVTGSGIIYYLATAGDNLTIGGAGVTQDTHASPAVEAFTESITGLTGGTAYKYRAYAINAHGTSYGAQATFTTDACPCNPCYSVASGNIDASSTWATSSGGTPGATIANDGTVDVVIEGGFKVNMNTNFSLNDVTVGATGNGELEWTAASVTLTIKDNGADDGSITVASGGEIDEGGQTEANIEFADATPYTLVCNDVTPGIAIDNIVMSGAATLVISGAGTIDIKDDFKFTSNGVTVTNNLTGTFTIADDLSFGEAEGASATIWSEDFEAYADNTTVGTDNNDGTGANQGANGVNDWTLSGQGADWFRVQDFSAISGTKSMMVDDASAQLNWTSESIDITGHSNVIITLDYRDIGSNTLDNADDIEAQYELNGSGTWTQFGYDRNDQNVTATFTSPTISGSTGLRIRVIVETSSNNERWQFDNVLVVGANGTVVNNCTFTNNQTISLTGADADLYYNGSTNVFNNNGTLNVGDDIYFEEQTSTGATSCGFVAGTGSVTAIGDDIRLEYHDAASNNYITNDGTLTADYVYVDHQATVFTNSINGTWTIAGNMFNDDDVWTIVNAGTMTCIDIECDDDTDDDFTFTNSGILNIDDFILGGGTGGDDMVITNTGTINQSGTFKNVKANASTVTNSTNGRWNYEGTGHDTDVRLYCSAADNTFNYNAASDQQMITPQTNDYNHLEITVSGTKSPLSTYVIDIAGNLLISGTAVLDVNAQGNDITIAGNWTNTSSGGFTGTNEMVTFDGSGAQGITCSSIGTETFFDLTLNKSAGGTVTMNDHVTISDNLDFSGSNSYLDINANNLTISGWSNGDITGYDSDEFVIVDQTGYIKYTGISAGEVLNIPMGLAAGSENYALADLTMTNAGAGTLDANLCGQIAKTGEVCGGSAETDSVIGYTWNFVSTSTAADVSLTWDSNAELTDFNRALCVVAHYTGTEWESLGTSAAASTSGSLHTRTGTTTGFSPFGVQMKGSPLPVELLSFDATPENNKVRLDWITASEINNDYFTIQRSADGKAFDQIAIVEGAGNSFVPLSYATVDNNPAKRIHYYRLKQTDYDGTATYSNVVSVDLSKGITENKVNKIQATVFPNPASVNANVYLAVNNEEEEKEILVIVVNQHGQEMYSKIVVISEQETTVIALDHKGTLSKGLYFITGASEHRIFSKKLIVQ